MSVWRDASVLGVAVTLSGGVAFLLYTLFSSSQKKQRRERAERPAQRLGSAPGPSARSQVQPTGGQVLVLGLDGAGKTSLLRCIAGSSLDEDVTPTEGFNAVSINKEDVHIEFLEIGGTEKLRCYWEKYVCKAQLLVYVVDCSDATRLPLAKKHLHELIADLPHLALVILANKQDMEGACGITDLHEALSLAEVGDERKLFLIGTHVTKGSSEMPSSVQDAQDLIFQMVSDSR
ncbi:ADP-ribosylation factor-like protein 9 [Arapaima gigas]